MACQALMSHLKPFVRLSRRLRSQLKLPPVRGCVRAVMRLEPVAWVDDDAKAALVSPFHVQRCQRAYFRWPAGADLMPTSSGRVFWRASRQNELWWRIKQLKP